jgi:hypothetical protein
VPGLAVSAHPASPKVETYTKTIRIAGAIALHTCENFLRELRSSFFALRFEVLIASIDAPCAGDVGGHFNPRLSRLSGLPLVTYESEANDWRKLLFWVPKKGQLYSRTPRNSL